MDAPKIQRRTNVENPPPERIPGPLPYHLELREFLQTHEPDLWRWFSSAQVRTDYSESLRLELLKGTYRLDPDSHPVLHQNLDRVKQALDLPIPVTLYQAQNHPQPNAALFFIPDEGHIVFSGPVLELLAEPEIQSVLAHELAHYLLWQWHNGDLHITDRLLDAIANDPRAAPSHQLAARRFQLYTEIYADRGSWFVTRDAHPVISGLVKVQTGLTQVSAPAYLQQAEEIFARDDATTQGLSHPETFIRARALHLWQNQRHHAEPAISRMIEGSASLVSLDVLGQRRLSQLTHRLLLQLLAPAWFQSPPALGHARLFFPDFQPNPNPTPTPATDPDPDLPRNPLFQEPELLDYWCSLLLDFATVDPDLEDLPLCAAFVLSHRLGLEAPFEKLVARESKRKIRDLRKLRDEAPHRLARALTPP